MMRLRFALGLGANLDEGRGIDLALGLLSRRPGLRLAAISSLYSSPPWGGAAGGRYLNAVALIDSERDPWELMACCLDIERGLGRVRGRRDAPRRIDIDLLCSPGLRIDTPRLCLPHPRMLQRRFVLQPLCELAPGWVLAPGLRVRAALQRCPDSTRLTPVRELRLPVDEIAEWDASAPLT